MRLLLIPIFLFTTEAFAGLKTLGVEDLNLDYVAPNGTGTIEKVSIGMSKGLAHPLEVERIEDTFVVKTPMLDFTWIEPWRFLFEAERLSLSGAKIDAGNGRLDVSLGAGKLFMKGEYAIRNAVIHCEGQSELPELQDQVLENCRDHLTASADRFDVPLDGLLADVLARLPRPEEEEPLKNFTLTVRDGDFYMYFLASVVVKAGLRTWGAAHYEEEMKVLVIRIDLIKFGVLPVTALVLRELKERIKDPSIEVRPPFIRVRLEE